MVLPARFVFSRKTKERMERIEREFAGRKLVIETGRMAKQAAGSALVQFGETMVLAAVTVSDNESPLPFFPASKLDTKFRPLSSLWDIEEMP